MTGIAATNRLYARRQRELYSGATARRIGTGIEAAAMSEIPGPLRALAHAFVDPIEQHRRLAPDQKRLAHVSLCEARMAVLKRAFTSSRVIIALSWFSGLMLDGPRFLPAPLLEQRQIISRHF